MAFHNVLPEVAASLDPTEPILFGQSRITIIRQDMFDYSPETLPVLEEFDLIFSAAGRDAMDDYNYMYKLSWLLMAMASFTTTGLLMMYKSMWSRGEWKAPQPINASKDPRTSSSKEAERRDN